MASWHYAFFFPGTGKTLEPASGIEVFERSGLEIDTAIRPAVEIDDEGHLEYGDQVKVGSVSEIRTRLRDAEQLAFECRNHELLFSCNFATEYSNPYVMIGWSRRLFISLPSNKQESYWHMLRQFAQQINATHAIVVTDPPDYFEDRFLEIDGQRCLDRFMPSGREYEISSVWRSVESSEAVPEGLEGFDMQVERDGFRVYESRRPIVSGVAPDQ